MHRIWIVGLLAAALLFPTAAAAAAGGRIVFASNRADGARELYVVNGDGSGEHRLTFNNVFERSPVWSPDGSRIAFAGLDFGTGNWDVYTVDANGGGLQRLTTDPERDDNPQWTSDGRIVWQHGPFGCPCEAWIMNADGSGQAKIPLPGNVLTPDPAPNGSRLAYASDAGGSWSLHIAQLSGKADRQITQGPAAFGDFQPRWSPDGSRIAFLRDNTGANNDIYTVNPGGQDLHQLTATPTTNEFWESWSPDGQSLVYDTAEDGWRIHRVTLAGAITSVNTSPTAPFMETFDEGTRDSSLWHQISDPGGTIGEQGGRLVASISGSAVPGGQYNQVDQHWGSQCSLNGDFDMQVDYDLLTWPAFGGVYAALQAFFGNAGISRTSGPWNPPDNQQIVAYSDSGFAGFTTTAMSGQFRIARSGGTVSVYERSTTPGWNLVFTGSAPNPVVYGFGLWAQGDQFAHQDASVAFDNFGLSSGVLTCPDWWQDYAPDVSR